MRNYRRLREREGKETNERERKRAVASVCVCVVERGREKEQEGGKRVRENWCIVNESDGGLLGSRCASSR
jgi:hypothetical protein